MKFNFKIQRYQTDAVVSMVAVFAGQPCQDGWSKDLMMGEDGAGEIDLTDKQSVAYFKGYLSGKK